MSKSIVIATAVVVGILTTACETPVGAMLGGLIANQRASNQRLMQHTVRLNSGASEAIRLAHMRMRALCEN